MSASRLGVGHNNAPTVSQMTQSAFDLPGGLVIGGEHQARNGDTRDLDDLFLRQSRRLLDRDEIDDQADHTRHDGRFTHDAEPSRLDHPFDGRDRARDNVVTIPLDLDLIISDERAEPVRTGTIKQLQCKRRLAAARYPADDHRRPADQHGRRVDQLRPG